MFDDQIYFTLLKSAAVGLILGAVANRMKQRSFFGWAAIGAVAAAIFPGLSLVALMVLALSDAVPAEALEQIRQSDGIFGLTTVML